MTGMQIAFDLLRILTDGKFHSGTLLAQQLKVSRSSIWKGVNYLRKLEVPIQAVTSRGYRWMDPPELLNKETILAHLDPLTACELPRLDVVNVIPSTNDYLTQRLPHGIPRGTLCIAEAQTAGKGRMGKTWMSPLGANIYLSLYWKFSNKRHDLSSLSLVVGLAVLKALAQIAPLPESVGIKWPNDIWDHTHKLSGILIETANNHNNSQVLDVIIGIGLNVQMPDSYHDPLIWTDLKRMWGFTPSRNALVVGLLNAMVPMLHQFEREGFQPFADLWAKFDLLLGKPVQLTTPHQQQVGIAEGINERGELCVRMGDTLKAIRYGEISVRPEV